MNFLGVLVGGTLCNDTGFVMEAERDETSEEAGKPDILVPKPCPNGASHLRSRVARSEFFGLPCAEQR
jgi:hypothetical protein